MSMEQNAASRAPRASLLQQNASSKRSREVAVSHLYAAKCGIYKRATLTVVHRSKLRARCRGDDTATRITTQRAEEALSDRPGDCSPAAVGLSRIGAAYGGSVAHRTSARLPAQAAQEARDSPAERQRTRLANEGGCSTGSARGGIFRHQPGYCNWQCVPRSYVDVGARPARRVRRGA